ATFLGVAYREVARNLTQAAGARALGAAEQLALLMAQSTQQRVAEVRRAANTPVVRRCLERPSDESCAAARASFSSLAGTGPAVSGVESNSRRVEPTRRQRRVGRDWQSNRRCVDEPEHESAVAACRSQSTRNHGVPGKWRRATNRRAERDSWNTLGGVGRVS